MNYVNALVLPDEWQDRVRVQLKINDQREQITKRRDSLHSQLRRLNYQFEQGLFAEEDIPEYKAKAQRLIREINSLTIPSADKTVDLGDRLIGLRTAWGRATEMERHEILTGMFELIYQQYEHEATGWTEALRRIRAAVQTERRLNSE